MIEAWLPIAGFFDYEISSFGRVKSLKRTARMVSRTGNEFNINIKERILKQGICKKNNKIMCNFVILRRNNKSCIK